MINLLPRQFNDNGEVNKSKDGTEGERNCCCINSEIVGEEEAPLYKLQPYEILEDGNSREWLAESELRRHRGVFRKFVEGGSKKFFYDNNKLFVKNVLYNGGEQEERKISICYGIIDI